MATALTSYDQFFTELGKPPGSPTDYDLSGDAMAAPQGGQEPVAQPAGAQQPVNVNAGSATNRQTSQAQQPVQVNPGSTQNVQTTGFANPTQQAAPKKTSSQISLGSFAAPDAGPQAEGSDYSKLFAPLGSQISQGREQLAGAATKFSGEVSPIRDYASSGAEEALRSAIGPGATAEQTAAAKGLVGAKYAGPTQLDQGTMDQLTALFSQLSPRAGSLQTGLGIEDLLRGQAPGLSEGQRRFEAKRILQDPGYSAQARQYEQGIQELYSDFLRAQGEARDIGTQRTGEEADIAKRSRELLSGEQGSLNEQLAAEVKAATDRERQLEEAYGRFQETGSAEDLAALQAFGGEGQDFSGFDTEIGRKDVAAEQAKSAIVDDPKYAAIKDVPTMALGINEHGRETLEFDPAWWKENKARFPAKKPKGKPEVMTRSELKALVRERQLALEQGGFSPGSGAAKNQKSVRQEASKQAGEHAVFDPLYYKGQLDLGEFEPQDTRSYVTRQEAELATPEAIASSQERERFNAIADLLGEADRLEEIDPYTAGEIRADVARYVGEQEAEVKSRTEKLEGAAHRQQKTAAKSRKKVREQRLAKGFSKRIGNETLGSTLAGIAQGDPKAVANLPFAIAATPVDEAMDASGSGEGNLSQTASLVKAPVKQKKKAVT